jgi:hypothetical protein
LHLGAGCHDPRGLARPHGHIDQSHTVDPAAAACTASGCHDGGLAVEHENASVTDTSGTRTGCNVCHTPYTMPSTTNCITCHPEKVDGEGNVIDHGFSATAHTSIDATTSGTWTMALAPTATLAGQLLNAPYPYSLNCSVCHDLRLDTEHAKATAAPVNPSVCTDCHPTPRDSITGAWDKSCTTAGCHATPSNSHGTTAPLDPHKVAASLTTCTPDGVGCSATPGLDSYARTTCHTTDLVQEHNRKIGGFNPYPTQAIAKTISVSCQQCHTSEAYASLNGSWDGTCDACHDGTALPNHSIAGTARYDEVHALHEASRYYDSGFTSSTGVRVAGTNAMDAHGPLRTALSNTRYIPYGCGLNICHTQFWVAAGLDGYYRANLCADCHGPNIAPIPAYQGSYTWKSGAYSDGYSYTTALTLDLAPITLPPASSLDFKTYYNIETDWDYGYVQVSTDNGATWTNLAGTGTTTTNPNGQNLGNGITGSSGGEWRDAHFDLSAYAGQVVKLRFNYVCDPYTYGDGWFLDVLTVGPAGSPVFVDDVETLKPEWTVTSNRTTKWRR